MHALKKNVSYFGVCFAFYLTVSDASKKVKKSPFFSQDKKQQKYIFSSLQSRKKRTMQMAIQSQDAQKSFTWL